MVKFMKNVFILLLTFSVLTLAQFKDKEIFKPTVKDAITAPTSNLIFGLIDPNSFTMNHSFNLSYSMFGSNALALSIYTNSLKYKFTDNLDVQVDASIIQSPYSSFGKNFQNQIGGIYLTRAELNYKPWENFSVSVLYRNLPANFYSPYYYGNYNGFGRGYFDNDFFIGK